MLLLTSALALFAGTAVQAAVHQVDVGNGGLTYTPNTVTAVDRVHFVCCCRRRRRIYP